jgi:hypothetical protein
MLINKRKCMKNLTIGVLFIMLSCMVTAQTVYVTKTGTKYHASGCRYLSKSCISISLADAKADGYTPCSVCKPTTTIKTDKKATAPKSTATDETKSPQTQVKQKSTTATQCTATTQKGTRCKRTTTDPSGKCWQHQ